jgi:uncharacterized protein YcbX
MVIDPDGVGITQRIDSRLALLTALPRPGGLTLRAPGRPDRLVDEPVDGPKEIVRVFRRKSPVPARLADDGGWLAELLERDARLAWLGDPSARTIEQHAQPGDRVSFADAFPLLLASAASLDAVNDWLAEAGDEPIPMTRFRPNVVVEGAAAWAEDGWVGRRLRIGDLVFRVAEGCSRCLVTTIDQETAEVGRQPLRVLGERRRFGDGLLFAVNLIPDGTGVIRVGEPVLDLA